MGLFANLASGLGNIGSIVLTFGPPFIFVLSLVVFVHELGHFLVARLCGVTVETFSIGFGPALISRRDRKGTIWQISWLPFGGYVKFAGDEDAASNPDLEALDRITASNTPEVQATVAGLFHFKPLAQRAAVVAGGPFSNFIFAILVFAFMFTVIGEQRIPPLVGEVGQNTPAAAAGFKPGDLVRKIDGRTIDSFGQMQEIVGVSPGRTLSVVVDRGGAPVTLTATPEAKEVKDRFNNVNKIGVLGITSGASAKDVTYVRYDPLTALWRAIDRTGFVVERTLSMVGQLITGRQDASQLSGPIGIAKISGEIAQLGFGPLITLAALLSISVGLLNLFPIPLLDGGHLMYYAYEAIRGRPPGARAQELGFRIGLALVVSLMVFATWNDLFKMIHVNGG
jgi:regulator of sigma E protease